MTFHKMSEINKKWYADIGGKALAVILAFAAVFIMVFCQFAVYLGVALCGFDTDLYDGVTTTLYSIVSIAAITAFIRILSYKREPLLKKEKLNATQIIFTIVVAFGLMGLVNLFFLGLAAVTELFPDTVGTEVDKYTESVDRYAEYEAVAIPNWDHILEFIGVAFLVPMAEELTFRGAVLGSLLRKFRPAAAVIISAVIFGILHGISIHIVYALLCGIVLGWVYFYTESIWASYMLHALFNLMGSALATFLDSGIFGDISTVADNIAAISFFAEMISILPALASFVFLRMIYKTKQQEREEAAALKESSTNIDEDESADITCDE